MQFFFKHIMHLIRLWYIR